MWSKLPASRWCLTTVCSVAELYSLWTHIWKNPIWVSHTAEAWRANKRLSALWENMLILQARHSSSCSSPRLIPPGFLTWLLLHLVHTFDSFLQLRALSNRYKKSCFEAGLSAVLCVRPPKKRDHNGVLKPSQSRARCFERKVGSCLSVKSPGGGFGSIKKTCRLLPPDHTRKGQKGVKEQLIIWGTDAGRELVAITCYITAATTKITWQTGRNH